MTGEGGGGKGAIPRMSHFGFMSTIVIAAGASLASGCSWEQAYYAGQAWQRNACNRLVEQNERERCIRNADMSYQEYRRRAEAAKQG